MTWAHQGTTHIVCHVIDTHLNPRFLSEMASYDVAAPQHLLRPWCGERLADCPICRRRITTRTRVFI